MYIDELAGMTVCMCVRMRREPKGKRINIKTHFFIKRNSYINMEQISKLSGTIH